MKRKISFILIMFVIMSCKQEKIIGKNNSKSKVLSPSIKVLNTKNDFFEINNIDMNNLEGKLNYLIKKLYLGKKYSSESNIEFLNYIIIGEWHCPPNEGYLFYKNNEYKITYMDTLKKKGKWRISKKGLELSEKNVWKKTKIFFKLEKSKITNSYTFSIFDKDYFFLLQIDSNIAKLWSKNSSK